jgi:hypothetical protein
MLRVAAMCVVVSVSGCDIFLGIHEPLHATRDASVRPDVAAAKPDAKPDAAFDPATCPSGYGVTLPSSTSKYRLIATTATISVHHADCKDDLAGATHLIALQTAAEATELGNAVAGSSVRVWVGLIQKPTATTPSTDWFVLTGEMLPANLWDVAEPEDAGGGENGAEQIAFVEPATRKLKDDNSGKTYHAMCECDGRPIDPSLDALIP